MKHIGKVNPVPFGLVQAGPLIQVKLQPSRPFADAIIANGGEVRSVSVKLMIDTGAQKTVIEDVIAQQLGLNPIRYELITGVSQVPHECPVYRVDINIAMSKNPNVAGIKPPDGGVIFSADIVGVPSPNRSTEHKGLLGRDFLRYVKLIYNGPDGSFEVIDAINRNKADQSAKDAAEKKKDQARIRRKLAKKAKRKNRR